MTHTIVIIGPTASGKSSLAIQLARKFNGEIISADSRQVYKGMDIGSGKVSKKEQRMVPHHLLDVVSPKRQYTVSHYKRDAAKVIKTISDNKKLPFIVGGTAFYIYALIDDLKIPEIKPNADLRKKLSNKTIPELQTILKNLDPKRYRQIDAKNPVRLIRAIEINISTGHPVPPIKKIKNHNTKTLIIGIKKDRKELDHLIDERVDIRLKNGMIAEVKRLLKEGVGHKKLQWFGLEYKYISLYLQGKLTRQEMDCKLKTAIHQFSRRQMTWFKRDKRINWVTSTKQGEALIERFIK